MPIAALWSVLLSDGTGNGNWSNVFYLSRKEEVE
jgi:hypothetical protein